MFDSFVLGARGSVLLLFRNIFLVDLLSDGNSRLVCRDDEVDDPVDKADPLLSVNLELIKFPLCLFPPPTPPSQGSNNGVPVVLGS